MEAGDDDSGAARRIEAEQKCRIPAMPQGCADDRFDQIDYLVGLFDLLVVLPVWPPVAAGPPVSPTALPAVTPVPAPAPEAPVVPDAPDVDFFALFLDFFLALVPELSLAPLLAAAFVPLLLGAWVFPAASF